MVADPRSDAHKQRLFDEFRRRLRSCVPWSPAMPYTPELNLVGDTYHTLNVFPELAPSDAPVAELNPAERADSPNKEFRYCIRLHRAGQQLMTWYGNQTGTVLFDSDVHIPAIYQCRDGEPGVWNEFPWMSLTPAEILTLREGSRLAKGRVVIAGLGLGHQLIEVSKRLTVKEIVLVERSQLSRVGHILMQTEGRDLGSASAELERRLALDERTRSLPVKLVGQRKVTIRVEEPTLVFLPRPAAHRRRSTTAGGSSCARPAASPRWPTATRASPVARTAVRPDPATRSLPRQSAGPRQRALSEVVRAATGCGAAGARPRRAWPV